MPSGTVWIEDDDPEKIAKLLAPGETPGQFLKNLVHKNLSENSVTLDCSEEEIAVIDSGRNGKSRDEYLHELIRKGQTESSEERGEGVTKIDLKTLLVPTAC